VRPSRRLPRVSTNETGPSTTSISIMSAGAPIWNVSSFAPVDHLGQYHRRHGDVPILVEMTWTPIAPAEIVGGPTPPG
jgi:hypothetical protein